MDQQTVSSTKLLLQLKYCCTMPFIIRSIHQSTAADLLLLILDVKIRNPEGLGVYLHLDHFRVFCSTVLNSTECKLQSPKTRPLQSVTILRQSDIIQYFTVFVISRKLVESSILICPACLYLTYDLSS